MSWSTWKRYFCKYRTYSLTVNCINFRLYSGSTCLSWYFSNTQFTVTAYKSSHWCCSQTRGIAPERLKNFFNLIATACWHWWMTLSIVFVYGSEMMELFMYCSLTIIGFLFYSTTVCINQYQFYLYFFFVSFIYEFKNCNVSLKPISIAHFQILKT